MKLLIENWRKFLTEDEGDYFPWLEELRANAWDFIEKQTRKDGHAGAGSFRQVVIPESDPDFVIKKMASGEYYMNKVEKKLGDEYPEVFPRVYAHDPRFDWIVVDRVIPLSRDNESLLEEALVATMPKLYEYAYSLLNPEGKSESLDTKPFNLFSKIVHAADTSKPRYSGDQLDYPPFREEQEIRDKLFEFGMKNEPWFVQLSKAMHRYGVDSRDLKEGNIGLDTKDHTLKIIDASVFSKKSGEKNWDA